MFRGIASAEREGQVFGYGIIRLNYEQETFAQTNSLFCLGETYLASWLNKEVCDCYLTRSRI